MNSREFEDNILRDFPERFYKTPQDKYGNVTINDVLNTEPVCQIYAGYHPYAVDLILNALRRVKSKEVV